MMSNEDSWEDRALVADFLATRSEASFLRLYDRHADAVYRFAARLAGGPLPEAADIAQDAWMDAIASLPSFAWRSALRTWLCGVVLNRWREACRRRERDRREGLTLVEPLPAATTDPLLRLRLDNALARLPDGYREVLVLHDLEGYTHEEIAGAFGIAEGTSKSQLHRARRALREAMTSKGESRHAG